MGVPNTAIVLFVKPHDAACKQLSVERSFVYSVKSDLVDTAALDNCETKLTALNTAWSFIATGVFGTL